MNANNDIAAIGSCPYSNQEYAKDAHTTYEQKNTEQDVLQEPC